MNDYEQRMRELMKLTPQERQERSETILPPEERIMLSLVIELALWKEEIAQAVEDKAAAEQRLSYLLGLPYA